MLTHHRSSLENYTRRQTKMTYKGVTPRAHSPVEDLKASLDILVFV